MENTVRQSSIDGPEKVGNAIGIEVMGVEVKGGRSDGQEKGQERGRTGEGPLGLGEALRQEFPIFAYQQRSSSSGALPLSYLDSAASTQKHRSVIDRLSKFLSHEHANIHRGAYALSADATLRIEEARAKVAAFLGAKSPKSVVFTRGTTESINLVAHALENEFQPGDVVLLSMLEHHSNIVPWQLLAKRRGVRVAFVEMNKYAVIDEEDFRAKLLNLKPKLVAVTSISNAFGSVLPIKELVRQAKEIGAITLVDGAQHVAHMPTRVEDIGCDFFAFSGHKLYGPTGIGALYVREEMYPRMEPFQGGGDMIATVTVDGSTWAEPPQKFEAGTPAIAEAIALGTAIDFVQSVGWKAIAEHEHVLFELCWDALSSEPGVTLYGPRAGGPSGQVSIVPFNVEGVHPHDFSTIADSLNVQVRAGHHCAMPALMHLGIQSTVRASLGIYSCPGDVTALCQAIRKARSVFA